MDYYGQYYAERVMKLLLVLSFGLSIGFGLYLGSVPHAFMFAGAGTVLCSVASIPSWPCYNSHPISWALKSGKGKEE
ncbi:MAG: microsomal signal peptidase 12kDa subunit [Amphiamblys sp. WSBS2006]|nr:MAG: microsomal signal peptidase 12kDa subunit [Amphiamblys sp. WSBS2006]